MLRTKDEKKKRKIGQIPEVAKVIFEIRQPLRHTPIGYILEPKDFENRKLGVKSPHLVTLVSSSEHKSRDVKCFAYNRL